MDTISDGTTALPAQPGPVRGRGALWTNALPHQVFGQQQDVVQRPPASVSSAYLTSFSISALIALPQMSKPLALRCKKLLADVLVEHGLAVIELGNDGIDLGNFLVQLRRRNRPRQLAQTLDQSFQTLEIRLFLPQLFVDRLDAFGDLFQAPLGIARAAARKTAQVTQCPARSLATYSSSPQAHVNVIGMRSLIMKLG
jgi:hypothetical protein